MTIIRQQSLFGIQELYDMEPTQQYQEIMSTLDLDTIFFAINKKSSLGAPVELNYGSMIGYDEHFAPTCFREHTYRYDSYDPNCGILKYRQPLECKDCPLANQGQCQKVYRVRSTTDLRKYTVPARGSKAWKKVFARRTTVERVNAYLKEFY